MKSFPVSAPLSHHLLCSWSPFAILCVPFFFYHHHWLKSHDDRDGLCLPPPPPPTPRATMTQDVLHQYLIGWQTLDCWTRAWVLEHDGRSEKCHMSRWGCLPGQLRGWCSLLGTQGLLPVARPLIGGCAVVCLDVTPSATTKLCWLRCPRRHPPSEPKPSGTDFLVWEGRKSKHERSICFGWILCFVFFVEWVPEAVSSPFSF